MVNRKHAGMCTPSGSEGGGHRCVQSLAYDVTGALRRNFLGAADSLGPDRTVPVFVWAEDGGQGAFWKQPSLSPEEKTYLRRRELPRVAPRQGEEEHAEMESSWKGILAALVVMAGLAASGSSYKIIDGPKNATVLVGWEASFNCTVSQGWKLIMWALNGMVVLSVTPKEPIITNDRFTSASYEEGDNFISEMIIHNVQPSDAGLIECRLQNSNLEGSAFLSVQVVGKLLIPSENLVVVEDERCNVTCHAVGWTPLPDLSWKIGVSASHSSYYSVWEPDDLQSVLSVLVLTPQSNGTLTCVANMKDLQVQDALTVNLTVVPPHLGSIDKPHTSLPTWAIALLAVSFSLLFILIIVLIIIFCCFCVSRREKKESSAEGGIMKSANVKTNKETSEPELKSGHENYGYSSGDLRTTNTPSLPSKSSDSNIPERQSSGQPQQGPAHPQPFPRSRPHISSPRVIKNVTLV